MEKHNKPYCNYCLHPTQKAQRRDSFNYSYGSMNGIMHYYETVALHEGIYFDQLQEIFTAETGLHTRL